MKTMKKIIAASILLAAFGANADNHNEFYGGVGIAKTSSSIDAEGTNLDYDAINLKLLGGMKITNNFSAEVQFANFKNDSVASQGGVNVDMKGKSFGIAGLYYLDDSTTTKPFVKLGVHRWDADLTVGPGGAYDSASYDGTDLFGSLGVDFANDSFTTRVEYETYKMGSDVNETMKSFGVSAMFKF